MEQFKLTQIAKGFTYSHARLNSAVHQAFQRLLTFMMEKGYIWQINCGG